MPSPTTARAPGTDGRTRVPSPTRRSARVGAKRLAPDALRGAALLNRDGEQDGVFLTSCAGGTTMDVMFRLGEVASPVGTQAAGTAYRLRLQGLSGGHSGLDIDKGRVDGILAVAGLLRELSGPGRPHPVRLAEFRAPGAFNAISRGATVVFVTDAPGVAERVAAWRDELAGRDEGAQVAFEQLAEPVAAYNAASSARVLGFLGSVPDGVFTMSSGLAGLVESSLNTGVVNQDGESLTVTLSTRSSDADKHRELSGRLLALALAHGADVKVYGAYPAWQFDPDNPLLAHAVATYTELFGKPPTVTGVHGGLECGVLADAYPGLPMLSVGAELTDCHTPRERADIASIERLTALVVRIVETLP